MSTQDKETLPETAAPAKPMAKKKPFSKAKPVSTEMKKKKKGKGPGKYSQLVIDAIKTLSERNGSSLFKIYNEAKKVSWFDQEHGRVYLRYSIRALLQNDTLVQVKGLGANGSFKLNKNKFTTDNRKSAVTVKKTAKPTKKPTKKADEKNKSVSGVKKAGSKAKKTTKPKKEDKSPAAAAKKSKKAKQPKKTVKKA